MNSKINKELRRIMRSIPQELQNSLVKKQNTAPVMNELYERALNDPQADPEAVRKLGLMKKAGMLDQTEEVADEQVVEKINAYVDEQINLSIKLGRLPAKDSEEYKKYAKKYGKLNKQISSMASETAVEEEHPQTDSPE